MKRQLHMSHPPPLSLSPSLSLSLSELLVLVAKLKLSKLSCCQTVPRVGRVIIVSKIEQQILDSSCVFPENKSEKNLRKKKHFVGDQPVLSVFVVILLNLLTDFSV